MRKLSFSGVITFVLLLMSFSSISHALEISSLDDKFDVFLFCTEDAGDYCDGNEITKDQFYFNDGEFTTDWFEEQLWGFNDPGSYDEDGSFFSGDYEVYNESAEKYEIDFQGISLLDEIIIGIMDIKYYEWDFLKFKFEKEDDTSAYFLGIRK